MPCPLSPPLPFTLSQAACLTHVHTTHVQELKKGMVEKEAVARAQQAAGGALKAYKSSYNPCYYYVACSG